MVTRDAVWFQWQDYLVFSVMLMISSVIGLYFGIQSKRKHLGADEMLTGGRNLPVIPVALSLSAGFVSATSILGIPAEVYSRGGEIWLWCFGLVLCFLVAVIFIVPFFHKFHFTNSYKYLEVRFNKTIRYMGSVTFSIIILTYMAAVLYAPAVALSQVTGISKEVSMLGMGLVCTFYTAIGGIRAVVWTDAFQLVVVWVGLVALLFKGASDVGGWGRVWQLSQNGSRLPEFNMDPNPYVRHSFWTLLIGGSTNCLTIYGANQTNLQRYASVSTLRGARIAVLLNLPLWILYITVLTLLGLVMYAYYVTCDPIVAGSVVKKDQLIPLFVLDVMGDYSGLPGLFVACLFSASVSTLSSGINSLAAVTMEDIFMPIHRRINHRPPTRRAAVIATVILTAIFGATTIGLAYLASLLGQTAFVIAFSIFGIFGGPLLGLVTSGIFFPFINSWGAGVGLVTSLVVCFYVGGIDPVINPSRNQDLPLRTDGCPARGLNVSILTTTALNNTTTTSLGSTSGSGVSDHQQLSYMHYSTLALLVSWTVGILVSAITCFNKDRQVDKATYWRYSGSCCTQQKTSKYAIKDTDTCNKQNDGNDLAARENPDHGNLDSCELLTRGHVTPREAEA